MITVPEIFNYFFFSFFKTPYNELATVQAAEPEEVRSLQCFRSVV
jgi:hypothetical protein